MPNFSNASQSSAEAPGIVFLLLYGRSGGLRYGSRPGNLESDSRTFTRRA